MAQYEQTDFDSEKQEHGETSREHEEQLDILVEPWKKLVIR